MHLIANYSSLLSLPSLFFPWPLLPYLFAVLSACQGQTGLRRSVLIKTGCGDGGGRGNGGRVDTGPGQMGRVQLMMVISKQSPRQQCAVIFRSYSGYLMHYYPRKKLSCCLAGAQCVLFIGKGYDLLTRCGLSIHLKSFVISDMRCQGETERNGK